MRGFGVVVFWEGREFAPAVGAADEGAVPSGDPSECDAHPHAYNACGVKDFFEWGQRCSLRDEPVRGDTGAVGIAVVR